MACHRLGIVRATFERSDGERVTQIVNPRPSRSWTAAQADRSNDLQEDGYLRGDNYDGRLSGNYDGR